MTWDDEAATWDANEGVRAYARAAFASLEKTARKYRFALAGASVCDFGCGTGLLTDKLAERSARVDAVDSSAAMLAVLNDKIGRHEWPHVRALSDLPVEGEPYDLVVCSSVCAFLDDYPKTVKRLAARLRPGGLLLQWDWELDPADDEPFGLTQQGIGRCLGGAGLEVLRVDTAFSVDVEGRTMSPLLGVGRKPQPETAPAAT